MNMLARTFYLPPPKPANLHQRSLADQVQIPKPSEDSNQGRCSDSFRIQEDALELRSGSLDDEQSQGGKAVFEQPIERRSGKTGD